MSNYYLQTTILENCPYGNATLKLLNDHNIKTDTITVNQNNKENYKTDSIQTFPQIYLKKKNSKGTLLLGGYDDLVSFINKFKLQSYSKENIDEFVKNNKNWSRKATLRFIEMINLPVI
jgi:glutaredoxin